MTRSLGATFVCVCEHTDSEEVNLTEILLPNVFSVLINEDGKVGETERALTHIDRYVNEFGFEPNVYLYTGMWPQQKRRGGGGGGGGGYS